MFHVPSSDGVTLAVHELAGSSELPPLLLSHATGFHAHCYVPIARALGDRFHCLALDYRGHGESTQVPGWKVDWARFGDDALAVAHAVAPEGGLVGFGHSMGGSALVMAACREPSLFSRLVLFEPIAHQPGRSDLSEADMRTIPIVSGALRRRTRFASHDDAYGNFRSKPPMSLMTDDALRNYVDFGFRDVVDEFGGPAVELRCSPQLEAGIFMTGRDNGVWPLLAGLLTPAVVIGGRVEEMQPSSGTEAFAAQVPNGEYVLLSHQTHFGPFSHPEEIADFIARPA